MIKIRLNSIFTKILLLIICLAFLINMVIFVTFHLYSANVKMRMHSNEIEYARYLMNDIGNPPSKIKAEQLSKRLGYYIEFSDGFESWATGNHNEKFPHDRLPPFLEKDGLRFVSVHGYTEITYPSGGGSVIIRMSPEVNEIREFRIYSFVILGIILFILAAAFFVIKRMLLPVKKMHAAIEEVKNGNYSFKIHQRGNGELAQLCRVFNELTSEIERAVRSREQLLADISHELRTPLTSMRVAADMVKDEELRESIIEDINSMDSLTGRILDSAHLNVSDKIVEMECFDFSALLKKCVARFNTRGVEIKMNCAPGIMFCASKVMTESLFNNLLDNAVKYSVNTGHPVMVHVSAGADGLSVIVKDRGQGIPAKDLPFITEPFYRSDSARTRNTGYGLGLSLCRKITEIHGGILTVRSEEGVGTEVCVSFPKELLNI